MRYFVSFVLVVMVMIGISACERAQQVVNPVLPQEQEDVVPVVIERSHIYESDLLVVSLPGTVGTVTLVEHLADELGNPEIILLTVQNGTTIHRDPSWFSENQEIKWFALKAPGVKWGFRPFYWMAPGYTLEEYAEKFRKISPPIVEDFEIYNLKHISGIEIFFEQQIDSMRIPGLEHKTRINSDEYVQIGVWSTRSTKQKDIWSVSFTDYAPGSSVVSVSAILMTERGDYEVPSNTITIPHKISGPVNFIE